MFSPKVAETERTDQAIRSELDFWRSSTRHQASELYRCVQPGVAAACRAKGIGKAGGGKRNGLNRWFAEGTASLRGRYLESIPEALAEKSSSILICSNLQTRHLLGFWQMMPTPNTRATSRKLCSLLQESGKWVHSLSTMTLSQQKTDGSLIHNPLSSKSICYSMITESTAPRNEVLPKSQTPPPPESVCGCLSLSLSLLSLIFTPTFPVWPRHPAGIFWDHFPWLISSQLISDDRRLLRQCTHFVGATPHARHLWEGSIQDPSAAAAGTTLQIPLCFQGIWLGPFLFAFVWKGLKGICYLDSVHLSVKGGYARNLCFVFWQPF